MSPRARHRAPFVVAVGGCDPSCGAGIEADVRTLDVSGVAPAVVVTAVTVQAGAGVDEVSPVSPDLVARQLRLLLADLPVRAVKLGLLPLPETVETVARVLSDAALPVVVDPVLEAGAGGRLAASGVPEAIVDSLFPLASLVTANLGEASLLTGIDVAGERDMYAAARRLTELGARAGIVKGGHLAGQPVDVLWDGTRIRRYAADRLGQGDVHGTGCAFASAVAAGLARGHSLARSVVAARRHVRSVIAGAARLDNGAWLRQPPRGRRRPR